jgi:hypothetical protein
MVSQVKNNREKCEETTCLEYWAVS